MNSIFYVSKINAILQLKKVLLIGIAGFIRPFEGFQLHVKRQIMDVFIHLFISVSS